MEFIFYEAGGGSSPVDKYLDSLEPKARAFVEDSLKDMQGDMEKLFTHSKHLKEKIYEIKLKFSTADYRILYFFFDGQRIVLVSAFTKKTQKTPPRELKKAIKRYKDWMERHENAKRSNR